MLFIILFSFISCQRSSNLKITSTPSGATVIINGQESGETPLSVKLNHGNYNVVLMKRGYNPINKEIYLKSRKQNEDFMMNRISLDEMVKIPAGEFIMGSSDEEIIKVVRELGGGELGPDVGWFAAERPQHKVYLDEFYIDKYEITNA